MKALTRIFAGSGVAAVALMSAAPAAAQYYPGYPPVGGYGTGGVIGQVINQVLGGGYGGYGQRVNSQAVIGQCVNAVEARLTRDYGYGYNGYSGYNGYNGGYGVQGYNPYGYNNQQLSNARVLGISRVESRSSGGLTVRGVATTGRAAAYGYGAQQPVDLTFRCRADYRGYIVDLDIDRAQSNYGQNYTPYTTPYANDYSQYGYRRY